MKTTTRSSFLCSDPVVTNGSKRKNLCFHEAPTDLSNHPNSAVQMPSTSKPLPRDAAAKARSWVNIFNLMPRTSDHMSAVAR